MKRSRACEDLVALESHRRSPSLSGAAIRMGSPLATSTSTTTSPRAHVWTQRGWAKRNRMEELSDLAFELADPADDELALLLELSAQSGYDRLTTGLSCGRSRHSLASPSPSRSAKDTHAFRPTKLSVPQEEAMDMDLDEHDPAFELPHAHLRRRECCRSPPGNQSPAFDMSAFAVVLEPPVQR